MSLPQIGTKVVFVKDRSISHEIDVPPGTTGVVSINSAKQFAVRIDQPPGVEASSYNEFVAGEWEGQIFWNDDEFADVEKEICPA